MEDSGSKKIIDIFSDESITVAGPEDSNVGDQNGGAGAKGAKYFGVTSPINLDKPSPTEVQLSKELLRQLREYNIVEPPEENIKKILVLDKLNKLAKKWIVELLIKKRMPESDARSVGGHIRTFGSYRLGVNTRGGDIDAVLIAPRLVDRASFFESFSSFMRGRSDVKNLRCITEAYVPVMKFNFCDLEFDLLFCQLSKYQVDDDVDLRSPDILKDMDMRDIRSINGFRIADEILSLVPNQNHFKITLHAIRLWAKNHELYSNIHGFLGGITWAIMVARVCQLYPYAVPATLVMKFFLVYSNWDWDSHPILLKKIEYGPMGMTLPQWLRNGSDQNRLMSVVTSTYPEQNTTHNITLSTRTIILNQVQKALNVALNVFDNKASWSELFEKTNFFRLYSHYLVATAESGTDVKLLEWIGFVESKLRLLVVTLEKNIFIKIAHPHCCNYPALPGENAPYVRRWFVGLAVQKSDDATLRIDLSKEIMWFENELLRKSNSSYYYPDKTVKFQHVRRRQLREFVPLEVIGKPSSSQRNGENETHESVKPGQLAQAGGTCHMSLGKRKASGMDNRAECESVAKKPVMNFD